MDDQPPILGPARAAAPSDARYAALFVAAPAAIAGAIHVEAAALHVGRNGLYVAAFATLAVLQLGWAVWIYRAPSPLPLTLGALLSAAVAAVWLVSRTVGVPVGPGAWQPEPVGVLDVAATLDELAIVAIGAAVVQAGRWPALDARSELALYSLVTLTAAALFAGGHAG
jgi:hypothetical protein